MLPTSKKAYPNFDQMQNIPGAHDTNKWIQAVKTIYYEEKKNQASRSSVINAVTKTWNTTEANDFVNWLRFYEEGTHLKYKIAHNWYGDAEEGYLLPLKKDPIKEEPAQIDFAKDSVVDEMSVSEKKKLIEKQRSKIMGRLDSAEKLLRSQDGQLFADDEFSSLLDTIYELKKKIHKVNKKSSSSKLYDDMIVREANILCRKGFVKAADLLYSLAEDKPEEPVDPPKPDEQPNPPDDKPVVPPTPKNPIPIPAPPAPPAQSSGAPGGLPITPSLAPSPAPNAVPTKSEDKNPKAIDGFLKGLNTGNKTTEDTLEVMDSDDDLVVEAQMEPDVIEAPEAPTTIKEPIKPIVPAVVEDPSTKEPLNINENKVNPEAPVATAKDFDNMMASIFLNLTIADVVAKFEDIAKFYKTREMPRQLAMADMMLDSLGLAPFFPALSEATNKALEANNYISTRLEDIISKLRGTMKTREIDMKNEDQKIVSPEVENAKQSLKEQADKESARKQMRKDIETESLQNQLKETPEVEIEEDLGNTPEPEPMSPAPPAPAPKPPAPAVKSPVV